MRLPEFLYRLSPVGEVLTALETGEEGLRAEAEARNSRLHVSTADEEGLALWEREFGLTDSAGRSLDARRTRVRTALAGGQTLTPAALKALALSVGKADGAAVSENAASHYVTLHALYDGEVKEAALELLREVVERLKPAHLLLRTVTVPPTGGRELCYRGTLAQGLSKARFALAACANSTHALFAGGMNGTSPQSAVDAYDRELSRVSASALSYSAQLLRGAAAGELMTFSGGADTYGSVNYSTVNAYNSALTRSTLAGLTAATREHMAASAGNYAVHGGGYSSLSQVNAYDETGAKTVPAALSVGRQGGVGAAFLGSAVIAGDGTAVDVYDGTLTHTCPNLLSVERTYPAAAEVGPFFLVAGGSGHSSVDAFDTLFTRIEMAPLSGVRERLAGAGVNGYAAFVGGWNENRTAMASADAYDALLTRVVVEQPVTPMRNNAAAVLGTHMLFAGGDTSAAVEHYEVI